MSSINPYQSTGEVHKDPFSMMPGQYGGIGRLAYFLGGLGISFAQNAVNFGLLQAVGEQSAGILILVVMGLSFAASAYLAGQRMINQGSSGWWGLGIIVPILNMWVGLRCLICPEGYTDHKTLDTTGKVLVGILLGAVILGVLAVIAVVATSA